MKYLNLRVNYLALPKDEAWENQPLVILGKESNNSYCTIKYLDFSQELTRADAKKEIVNLKTSKAEERLEPDSVIEIKWSTSEGLLSYKKLSGEIYNKEINQK